MSKFSNFFKNKKDQEDFYIALVVIFIFLIGGFYFGSSLMNDQSVITFNEEKNTSIQAENENFRFETEEEEQLTTAILKDDKKVKQLDDWLEKTPKMDSLDVAKTENQIATEDTKNRVEEVIENNLKENTIVPSVVDEAETEAQAAEKIRKEAEAIENRAKEIQENQRKADADKKIAEAEAQAKAKLEAEKKVAAKKKAEAQAKIKAEADRKAAIAAKKRAEAAKYNCAIIVGSFETAQPADMLKAQLIKQGYPAYTFFRKELKVVGIKTSCNNEVALQKQLEKIRKTFPESWVLRAE